MPLPQEVFGSALRSRRSIVGASLLAKSAFRKAITIGLGERTEAMIPVAVKTRAASRIEHFDELLQETVRKAPPRRTVDACEVGRAALLLARGYTSAITGEVLYVDAGFHIEDMVFH